jgi:predicted ATPase/class 3 adenylate cyclase
VRSARRAVGTHEALGDSSGMTARPAGTVTLLFTDIEGSTRLLERLGDKRYAEVLRLHRRLLRRAFKRHGGYEVDCQGDGFFVAFSRAEDAVAAASSAQKALAMADWPEDAAVRVRMGLHTGEPLAVAGGYAGSDVHRAARIMAAGHGEQVLLSQTTRDLLDDRHAASDLGEHRLKDLSAAQRLFQLQIEGRRLDFPPLRTLGSRPTNLPVQLTPLIGRERELAEVTALLRDEKVHLLTLTGTGGTGKTRLALQAAGDVVDVFPDGVFFVSLTPIHRQELVLPAIVQALALSHLIEPLSDALVSFLADKQILLLLDNFEHVLDAATVVAELTARCTKLTILATSRERLRVAGERAFPVSPLALPDENGDLGSVATNEAVLLFTVRAQEAAADFALDPENAAAVTAICRRLDGLPLAIELAAARTTSLPPIAMLRRLDRSLKLLTGGRRDADERHRTLQTTIEWSYDLLVRPERELFARLSVFVDGCRIEAAEQVGDPDGAPGTDILDALDSLVEKNLLRQRMDPDGEPRYWMFETIREYALGCLAESGERDDACKRQAEFFSDLAEQAEPELRARGQLEWLARLDAEQGNLWAAFGWALNAGEFELALRLGSALWRYWEARPSIAEARIRLDEALAESVGQTLESRPKALFASGRIALRQGDLKHARIAFAEGQVLFEATGVKGGMALCIAGLSWIAHVSGSVGEAVTLARKAVRLARASGEEWIIADALNNLGVALRARGDLRGAQRALEESLALRREIGDLEGVTAALSSVALIALAEGDDARADDLFRQAFAISERRGDVFYGVARDVVFGYLAFCRGELARARKLCLRALSLCGKRGYQQFAAYALETLAGVAAAEGRFRQAGRLFGAAVTTSERIRGALDEARTTAVGYEWEARAVTRVLDRARHELGSQAWDAAVAEGRGLDAGEALAHASAWTAPPVRLDRLRERAEGEKPHAGR